ncbi:gliding motility-associated ABC transporter permease subunit GldF [Mesonia aestuariivivens]|uniref:Gliding motility-associated ABC transporter permease subunit GldF n=1 Tax=Mesonia aestuariivivens TaxID=2796128 RepID=A0ABS6VZQ6_9FLAO|nr:gliding motility-associated ABC transporter permease subunit GldF [Mesonia aestuariivivens]MBW2961081.1 gliding motility-associated ABC transporter permease subunit GldF [Mesonia aestuariivivens]
MKAILLKEINSFFSSTMGYLVIGIFLLINGLFVWVFQGDFNILDFGFASLTPFFHLAPWIFIFLIPAITMRSFSEEIKQGTLELLLTKPITQNQLIAGKYLGALTLVILALLPTLLYVYTISELGASTANFDSGAIIGSYIGLLFLAGVYTAIGIFCSTLSNNQIVAFILGVTICFLCFYGVEGLSNINLFGSEIYALEYLGISYHYKSISRGIIDSRDVIYFASFIFLFLYLAKLNLKRYFS